MADDDRAYGWGTRRLFAVGAVVAVILAFGVTVWPFLTQNQLGTPKGGANPATASDTTTSRGSPAQKAAESTVGKNNPAGQADSSGGRAAAIKQSSQALQLSPQQREEIKDVIERQRDAPKVDRAPFEMMIGTSVPDQVRLKDIPPEIAQVMNGFWGDQYLLVRNEMVIVDQHSRRVVAIVPATA